MSNLLIMYTSQTNAESHTDGYVVPALAVNDGFKQTHSTLVNSGRNTQGKVIGQRTMDRDLVKLELKWNFLLNSQWRDILSKISSSSGRTGGIGEGFYIWIRYYDSQLGYFITREFYPSDRTASVYSINPTTGRPNSWVGCSMNFIDTGNSEEYTD